MFPSAIVNVINILPRTTENHQKIINDLNSHIKLLCERNLNGLKFVDTYSNRLFTLQNGARKPELFKHNYNNDTDNVHLNNHGVVKLGAHHKYLAHI